MKIKIQQIILIGLTKILAIIDINKFNHKNKIGKFKYIDIKDLIQLVKYLLKKV